LARVFACRPGKQDILLTHPAQSDCTRLQKVIMHKPQTHAKLAVPKLAAADELSDIRAELARLRLREAQLHRLIVNDPDLGAQGRYARVTVCLHQTMAFDPALLPAEVRTDPRYLRPRAHWALHCHPAPLATGPRPGWPIRREAALLH